MQIYRRYAICLTLFAGLFLGACSTSPNQSTESIPQNQTIDNNTSIIANPTDLAEFISVVDQEVAIEDAGVSGNSLSGNSAGLNSNARSFSLKLVATIDSPVVSGNTLQATSVFRKGNYIYAAYNTRGEVFTGAVDVIKVSNPRSPSLKSRTIFTNKDINDVYFYSSRLMLAVAMDTGIPANNSKIETYRLSRNIPVFDDATEQNVASYASTAVYGNKNQRFVTSGSTGRLYSFSKSLDAITSFQIADARWVSGRSSDLVVLSGGSNPALHFYNLRNESISHEKSFSISAATEVEAKSVVEMSTRYAFVAGNQQGVSIYNIEDEELVHNIPIPTSNDPDVDISTNSLSIYKDLMFISNGEAGVYVAQNGRQLTSVSRDRDMSPQVKGKLVLGDNMSANHVVYKNDVLVVASGTGGVKILTVSNSADEGDEDDDDDDDDDD